MSQPSHIKDGLNVMTDVKVESPRSIEKLRNLTHKPLLEISPDHSPTSQGDTSDSDRELSNLNRLEAILKSSIKGVYIKIKDIIFITTLINKRHMRLLSPTILKMNNYMDISETMHKLISDHNQIPSINFEVVGLVNLYETCVLPADIVSEVRLEIKQIEMKINNEIFNDKKEVTELLGRLHDEAEKRVLTNLYEVAKFLTVNKIDRRDIIIKLVDIIMKILSESHE
jgi:hypothetical protein